MGLYVCLACFGTRATAEAVLLIGGVVYRCLKWMWMYMRQGCGCGSSGSSGCGSTCTASLHALRRYMLYVRLHHVATVTGGWNAQCRLRF